MQTHESHSTAPLVSLRCYRHGPFIAVPHYTRPFYFVLPGSIIVHESDLRRLGWTESWHPLWPRVQP